MDLVHRFAALHAGRSDIYGAVHGECVREPLTIELWRSHLEGVGSVGIYPLVPKSMLTPLAVQQIDTREAVLGTPLGSAFVRLGCSDIDVGYDVGLPLARNLVASLRLLGLTGWLERTRSKGWHIWVYADEWIPAEIMRRALLAAHQVAGVPPTEVNPKSSVGGAQGIGNYINAPYAASYARQGKRVCIEPELMKEIPLRDFITEAERSRATFDALLEAAKLYVAPPKPAAVDWASDYDGKLESLVAKLGGLAYTIFTKGVLEGRDRSRTMVRLAHLIAEDAQHSPSEALALLTDFDERLGKYVDRPDRADILADIIQRAFA